MARIEFYTMAILTLPLLPFIVTSKFSGYYGGDVPPLPEK